MTDNKKASRRLPGASAAEFGDALHRLAAPTSQASTSIRRYVHVAFHRGEGQLPDTCEWCREALDGK